MDTYVAGSTIYHFFNTHKADGTPITLAGSAAIDIYKDNGTTQDADDSGLTLTVDFDSLTGLHLVTVDTSSDGTFYATSHIFNVALSAGTVDSVSVVGTSLYQFKLGEVPADAVKISGDSTAAENLEDLCEETTAMGNLIDMFDGTGYAGGTAKLQVDLVKILGTALTETAGQIAAGFKKVFDVSTPVFTAESVNQTGDSYAKVDTEIGTISTNVDAIKAKTDMQPTVWYSA